MAEPSQTLIINKANVLLGSTNKLTSINAGDTAATSFKALWDISRRAALVLHPFNFALTRDKLLPETEAPAFGWEHKFKLPADCLAWQPWSRKDRYFFEGEEEDGFILADDDEIYIRYIYDHTDITKWSPLFVELISITLAWEYCEGKTGLKGLQDRLKVKVEETLMKAKKRDGLSSGYRNRQIQPRDSKYTNARFGRRRRY